jgi:hypothetical protein
MAILVNEIMNSELFGVRPHERAGDALGFIVALGITGAPVLDDAGRPVGMVSFRDLAGAPPTTTVNERMTRPAVVVRSKSSIEGAGRLMGEAGLHRLPVVDEGGKCVGVVSALDVVRGLLGMPAVHPAAFPHLDTELGVSWTDDIPLEADRVEAAPDEPGILLLVEGGKERSERVVWGEAARSVRSRLLDLVSLPQSQPTLAAILTHRDLRFRAARAASLEQAKGLVGPILDRGRGPGPRTV